MKKQAHNPVNRKLSESDEAAPKPTGAVSGEFVTETFKFDGGREVTVYVPPDPPEAIVFAGDGQRISKLSHRTSGLKALPLSQRSRSP